VQAGEPAGTERGEHESGTDQGGHTPILRAVALAVEKHPHRGDPGQHREQECHIAEQVEQYVGQPGAGTPAEVLDPAAGAAMRPARIAGVVGPQRYQQVDGDGDEDIKARLTNEAQHLRGQRRPGIAFPGSLRHNSPRVR
jgi:hypothetical protein